MVTGMRLGCTAILGAVIFISSISDVHGQSPQVELLRTGNYHENETSLLHAGRWLGLFEMSDGWELREVEVSIQKWFDGIASDKKEDDPSTWTGWEVAVPGSPEPLMMVRGLPGVKAGRIKTFFIGRKMAMPDWPLLLGYGDSNIALRAEGVVKEEYGDVRASDYVLSLYTGAWNSESSQVLYSSSLASLENSITILWVGDLDKDGKPDVLLDTGNHYNVTEYSLYLSSCAEGNDLVKLVARFRSVGC